MPSDNAAPAHALPAPVVAWLCEATGVPWPLVWRMKPTAHHNPLNGDDWVRLPVDVSDPDAALLIDRRLAKLLGLREARAAWLELEPDADETHWFIQMVGDDIGDFPLPGIPDGVTEEDEARAWALCWLYGVAVCPPLYDGVDSWRSLQDRWSSEHGGVPLHTPLRDGVALGVPHE